MLEMFHVEPRFPSVEDTWKKLWITLMAGGGEMVEQQKRKLKGSGRKRLGRGLTSLISSPVTIEIEAAEPPEREAGRVLPVVDVMTSPAGDLAVRHLSLDRIRARSNQPRQLFDEDSLDRLAESIRNAGLMQPILVRPASGGGSGAGGGYEIIAGERRWRAARKAGLEVIPAIIRELDDESCAEWSLIENLQREDLNPIERAEAFQRLIDEYELTHQDVADRVGLDRSSITNHLRLNELDAKCKGAVADGRLSMGHAKALLGITNIGVRLDLLQRLLREQWSVRQLEHAVRSRKGADSSAASKSGGGDSMALANPQIEDLQRRLGEHLGTKVSIRAGRKKGAGKLIIEFYDLDHFENVMQTLQFPLD